MAKPHILSTCALLWQPTLYVLCTTGCCDVRMVYIDKLLFHSIGCISYASARWKCCCFLLNWHECHSRLLFVAIGCH
jgi:hypothetical protein